MHFNTYIPMLTYKGNDFAVLKKYHMRKGSQKKRDNPSHLRNEIAELIAKHRPGRKIGFWEAESKKGIGRWPKSQRARGEKWFHSRWSICFFRHGTHIAHERTRKIFCTDDLFVFFCRCYFITSKRTRLQLFHPDNEKNTFPQMFFKK